MDGLLKAGAEVVHSGIMDVHATGHAQADEIKTYLSIANPEWFVPVHGEFRHMMANARLGEIMGVARDNVIVCEDGDVLELTDQGLEQAGRVPAGYLYVDGIVGDVGSGVLRDRRLLASEGVVVVVVTVDTQTGKVLVGPEIITQGLGLRPRGRGPPRRGLRHDRRRRREGAVGRRARRRGPRARRAPGRREVRQRPHQAPPDDRPRGHGGVSRARRVVALVAAAMVAAGRRAATMTRRPVRPVLDQIAPAMAAVDTELGGPQQYFEVNATPLGSTCSWPPRARRSPCRTSTSAVSSARRGAAGPATAGRSPPPT